MPVWDINLTAGALSASEKSSLAQSITKIYTDIGLPAFYVQVRYHSASPTSTFYGGTDTSDPILDSPTGVQKYAGIQIVHLARTMDSEQVKERFLRSVDKVLNPVFKGNGWHWEYFVTEADRALWKINGIKPTAAGGGGGEAVERKGDARGSRQALRERLGMLISIVCGGISCKAYKISSKRHLQGH